MKKKILYFAAIVICISIITGGTLAHYTTEDTARNVITSGGVSVKIVEQRLVDGELKPYPNERIKMMPSSEVSKIVTVKNLEKDAWVRLSYTVTVYDAADNQMDITAEELKSVILIEPDDEKWTEKDGWWYYDSALESGESSTPLFESVTFSGPNMGNKYQGSTVLIDVIAEAVQKANNGDAVEEALGWSED